MNQRGGLLTEKPAMAFLFLVIILLLIVFISKSTSQTKDLLAGERCAFSFQDQDNEIDCETTTLELSGTEQEMKLAIASAINKVYGTVGGFQQNPFPGTKDEDVCLIFTNVIPGEDTEKVLRDVDITLLESPSGVEQYYLRFTKRNPTTTIKDRFGQTKDVYDLTQKYVIVFVQSKKPHMLAYFANFGITAVPDKIFQEGLIFLIPGESIRETALPPSSGLGFGGGMFGSSIYAQSQAVLFIPKKFADQLECVELHGPFRLLA